MMSTSPKSSGKRPRLGQLLVARSWITGEQLIRAIQSQRMLGGRLGTCLLEMDVLSEDRLIEALSSQMGTPATRIETLRAIDPTVLSLVPSRIAERCRAVPFADDGQAIEIAALDAADLDLLDEIAFCANRRVRAHVANEVRIYEALGLYYGLECPQRFEQLVDRLNRVRYLWNERREESTAPPEVEWQRADDVFRDLAPRALAAPDLAAPGLEDPSIAEPRPAGGPGSAAGGDRSDAAKPLPFRQVERTLAETSDPAMIGYTLIRFLAQSFTRCALLQAQPQSFHGWMGAGRDFAPERLARLVIRASEPSLFAELSRDLPFYRGSLPPLPAHRALVRCWNGELPLECVLVPIWVRGHLATVIYGDRGQRDLSGLRQAGLTRLAGHAGQAFERLVLARKKGGV